MNKIIERFFTILYILFVLVALIMFAIMYPIVFAVGISALLILSFISW